MSCNLGMKTSEQILKIRAMVLYLIKQVGELDYFKLFKLMYYAQQAYLVKYGRPIVQDTFHARQFGPVPAFTYKALRTADLKEESTSEIAEFLDGISVERREGVAFVNSVIEPDMDELAPAEICVIDQVISEKGHLDGKTLSEMSHADKAWMNAHERMANDPEQDRMTLIEIAIAGGASTDRINYLRDMQNTHRLYQA